MHFQSNRISQRWYIHQNHFTPSASLEFFRQNLRVYDVTKGGHDLIINKFCHRPQFSSLRKLIYTKIGVKKIIYTNNTVNLWIFYHLGNIGSQWRHKGGQDHRIFKFWHHHQFSCPKKHTYTCIGVKTNSFRPFLMILPIFMNN